MGAALVGETIAYHVEIPLHPNEYALLVAMALTALDGTGPRSRRYFDSREAMCLALGRRVADRDDDAGRAERASAMEFVRRALNGLLDLEAITQVKTARAGQRAEFIVNLDVERSRNTDEHRLRSSKRAAKRQLARRTLNNTTGPHHHR